jgi:hypothetical protein
MDNNPSTEAGEWSPDLRQSNEVLDRWQNTMFLFNDYAAAASHQNYFCTSVRRALFAAVPLFAFTSSSSVRHVSFPVY